MYGMMRCINMPMQNTNPNPNPIDTHSLTHRFPPAPDTALIIAVPPPEDAPRITARLLSTTIPFAVLLPSELAQRIADASYFPDQPDLATQKERRWCFWILISFGS